MPTENLSKVEDHTKADEHTQISETQYLALQQENSRLRNELDALKQQHFIRNYDNDNSEVIAKSPLPDEQTNIEEPVVLDSEQADLKAFVAKSKAATVSNLMSHTQSYQQLTTQIQNTFQSEDEDLSWSSETAVNLLNLAQTDELLGRYQITNNQCKRSSCLLSIAAEPDMPIEQISSALQNVALDTLGHSEYFTVLNSDSGEFEVYFARDMNSFAFSQPGYQPNLEDALDNQP